jgi:hypothetical protein
MRKIRMTDLKLNVEKLKEDWHKELDKFQWDGKSIVDWLSEEIDIQDLGGIYRHIDRGHVKVQRINLYVSE